MSTKAFSSGAILSAVTVYGGVPPPFCVESGALFVPSVKDIANVISPSSLLPIVYIISTSKPFAIVWEALTLVLILLPEFIPVPTITELFETLQSVASVAVNSTLS